MTDTPTTHPLSPALRAAARNDALTIGQAWNWLDEAADELDRRAAEIARLRAEVEALRVDAERLDAVRDNCWKLEPLESPNGDAGDASIYWHVTDYHRQEPRERTVAYGYSYDPRDAIDAARTPEGRSDG